MSKVMFSLPERLVSRMRAVIPAGERSVVLASILEKEIVLREDLLYQSALELEASAGLREEMTTWDSEFGEDGLDHV